MVCVDSESQVKFPLDIKKTSYLDMKVPFTRLKRREDWIDLK